MKKKFLLMGTDVRQQYLKECRTAGTSYRMDSDTDTG